MTNKEINKKKKKSKTVILDPKHHSFVDPGHNKDAKTTKRHPNED